LDGAGRCGPCPNRRGIHFTNHDRCCTLNDPRHLSWITSDDRSQPMRALAYHVATSIDGYIAAPDGSYDAFPTEGDHIEMLVDELPETLPGPALTALGIEPACATYDTVVMGWNTFAIALDAGLASPY